MEQSLFWVLPASAVGLGIAAGLYGWRLRVRFERDHPKSTRAALKAESIMEAEVIKRPGTVHSFRKVAGGDTST